MVEQAKIYLAEGEKRDELKLLGTASLSGGELEFNSIINPVIDETAGKAIIQIELPGFRNSLLVRLDTSDYPIFKQVFLGREYDFPIGTDPEVILDGGANVGYATVYFAERFPNARILAVEPEDSNFELLKANTAAYPKVEHLQAAIWHENSELNVVDIGLSTASYMVGDINSPVLHKVKAFCLNEIMQTAGIDQLDILKLDIEGAEREVFSHNYASWLDKVKVLIIELHEFRKVGTTDAFFSAVSNYKFEGFRSGENIVLVRQ